jgi:cytochrome c oxidase subunit 2
MLFNALGFSLNNQFGFQTAATPFMEGIIDLHHNLFFFMILIFTFVF